MSSQPRRWCPTCTHFFKDYGLNNCKLVDWSLNPLGGRVDVLHWLKMNSDDSSRIQDNAVNCPAWELAEKLNVKPHLSVARK